MERGNNGVELISQLPVEVIHHIMSCLPGKDGVGTSRLSKKWYKLQRSYPVLAVSHTKFREYSKLPDRYLVVNVNRSLSHFIENKLSLETFTVSVEGSKLFPDLDSWILSALGISLQELKVSVLKGLYDCSAVPSRRILYRLPSLVFSSKSLTVLELSQCFLDQPLSMFSHLRQLSLARCRLNGPIVLKEAGDCPLLECLKLKRCFGFNSIQITNLPRFKTFEFELYVENTDDNHGVVFTLDVACQSLHSLNLRDYGRAPFPLVNLTGCHRLKVLHLESKQITDEEFNSLLLSLPGLEELALCRCEKLRSISVSAPSLKTLVLCYMDVPCLESVEIASPSLKSFIFIVEGITKKSFCDVKVREGCNSLETLVLSVRWSLMETMFHELISKFPLLQNLWMFGCLGLQQINIPNQGLKRLHICRCYNLEAVKVDSADLCEFYLTGRKAPKVSLSTRNEAGQMKFEDDEPSGWDDLDDRLEDMLEYVVGIKDQRLILCIVRGVSEFKVRYTDNECKCKFLGA